MNHEIYKLNTKTSTLQILAQKGKKKDNHTCYKPLFSTKSFYYSFSFNFFFIYSMGKYMSHHVTEGVMASHQMSHHMSCHT